MTGPLALGMADRHQGQAATIAAATAPHRDDRHRVETALAGLIRAQVPFTAEDVRQAAGELTDDRPNLIPSVIGVAAAHRVIVPAGEYRSGRRSRRDSRNRVWIAHTPTEQ